MIDWFSGLQCKQFADKYIPNNVGLFPNGMVPVSTNSGGEMKFESSLVILVMW